MMKKEVAMVSFSHLMSWLWDDDVKSGLINLDFSYGT